MPLGLFESYSVYFTVEGYKHVRLIVMGIELWPHTGAYLTDNDVSPRL